MVYTQRVVPCAMFVTRDLMRCPFVKKKKSLKVSLGRGENDEVINMELAGVMDGITNNEGKPGMAVRRVMARLS